MISLPLSCSQTLRSPCRSCWQNPSQAVPTRTGPDAEACCLDLPSKVCINVMTSQSKQDNGRGLFSFPVKKQNLASPGGPGLTVHGRSTGRRSSAPHDTSRCCSLPTSCLEKDLNFSRLLLCVLVPSLLKVMRGLVVRNRSHGLSHFLAFGLLLR